MFAVGALAADQSKTKVYRCVLDGVVTYSQQKCAKDAQTVTVELKQGLPQSPETARSQWQDQQKQVNDYLNQQSIDRQVARHEAAISRYKQQMADEFTRMQSLRYRSENAKQKALNQLSARFNRLIRIEQNAIKRLLRPDKPEKEPIDDQG